MIPFRYRAIVLFLVATASALVVSPCARAQFPKPKVNLPKLNHPKQAPSKKDKVGSLTIVNMVDGATEVSVNIEYLSGEKWQTHPTTRLAHEKTMVISGSKVRGSFTFFAGRRKHKYNISERTIPAGKRNQLILRRNRFESP